MPERQASLGGAAAPGLGEDTGPHPVIRAVTGLLLGLGVGLASALLLRRRDDVGSQIPVSTNSPLTSSLP